MRGTPQTMQNLVQYENNKVVPEVFSFLQKRLAQLHLLGVKDVIVDPGFGFAKTLEQNYELLKKLSYFKELNVPILAGMSRKSMIYNLLKIQSEDALTGTIAINMLALLGGASNLRVHDVKEAVQVIQIFNQYCKYNLFVSLIIKYMGFQIGFKDIVDIFLVAFLLYEIYKLLRNSGAVNIFIGILAFIVCWFFVSYVFKMQLLGGILDMVVNVGAFALIVLFQDEIRRFFSNIGTRRERGFFSKIKKFFGESQAEKQEKDLDLLQVVLACRNMSKTNTGSLIVFSRNNNLDNYVQSENYWIPE
jgi:hypothetical protein